MEAPVSGLPPGFKVDPGPAQPGQQQQAGGLPPGFQIDQQPKSVAPTAGPTKLLGDFQRIGKEVGEDPNQLRAINSVEDPSGDPKAISSSGAVGVMQMKPDTFKAFSDPGANITDTDDSIKAGARYLKYLTTKYKGDMDKVYQAYNLGETQFDKGVTAEMYAKQVEANLAWILKDTKPSPAKLTKGAVKEVAGPPRPFGPPAPKYQKPAENKLYPQDQMYPGEYPEGAGDWAGAFDELDHAIKSMASNTASAAETTGQNLEANSPQVQEALQKLNDSGLVQDGAYAAQIVGQAIEAMSFGVLNAAMRDLSEGNTQHLGEVGQNLWSALGHPTAAGKFLDAIANKYGQNTADEISYWASKPGMWAMLSKGTPATPNGQALQLALGVRADAARLFATHTGVADLATLVGEWVNPAYRVGAIITTGAKGVIMMTRADEAAHAVVGLAAEKMPATAARVNKVLDKAPVIGNRYRRTQRLGGVTEAGYHFQLAQGMQKVPEQVHRVFQQADKLGDTSVPQRQAILLEHDLFNSPWHTTSVYQPEGGQPMHDPLTDSTVGVRGGQTGVAHDNYVYINSFDKTARVMPESKNGNAELREMYPAPVVNNFNKLVKAGKYAEAMKIEAGISPAEGKQFVTALSKRLKAIQDPKVRAGFAREMILRRLISANSKRFGHTTVFWGDKKVLFTLPQKAIERNTEEIAGMSVHDRAMNVANAVQGFDNELTRVLPSMASKMALGYWARGGAFPKEATEAEQIDGGMTAERINRSGNAQLAINGKRVYKSIREAEDAGEQMDPKFDPAESLHKSMVRSARLKLYGKYLQEHARPIPYAQVIRGAAKTGMMGRLETTVPAAFSDSKEFRAWLKNEAQKRWERNAGTRINTAVPEQMEEQQKIIQDDLYRRMENYFHLTTSQNVAGSPVTRKFTFRTAEETGLDDLDGYSVPDYAKDAAIDSHPAFDAGGAPRDRTLLNKDPAESKLIPAVVDGLSSTLRSLFLVDPTYHQRENLSYILFTLGKLNPAEIAQLLMAPHTIPKSVMDEAEKWHATSGSHYYGVGDSTAQFRNRYSAAYKEPGKLGPRRTLDEAFRHAQAVAHNANTNSTKMGVWMHGLSRALYTYSKWNSDLTFKVWEDASAAMLHDKFVKEFKAKGMDHKAASLKAAKQVRDYIGGGHNMTSVERQLGLQNLAWFYAWTKAQYHLWASKQFNGRALKTHQAVQQTINTQNAMTVPGDDAGKYDDKGEAVFWAGENRYAMKMTPGPWGKMQAMNALVSAIPSGGEGLGDFAKYVGNNFLFELNPSLKIFFDALPEQLNQGPQGNPNALMDSSMPPDVQAQQAAGKIAGAVAPTQAKSVLQAIQQSDPVFALGLLGVPVINYDNQPSRGDKIKESKLHKIETSKLYRAQDPAERADVIDEYGHRRALLQQLMQQSR